MHDIATNIFDELLNEPYNALIEEAINRGDAPVGYTCSYMPDVMLSVDGLFPVRMRAPGVAGTEIADVYLSSVICSYTRSLLEFAMDDRYDFLKGWVFTASCDHLRRLYDNLDYLKKPGFNYMLDVPHRINDAAFEWFAEELRALANALSDKFKIDMSADSLSLAIKRRNEFCGLLKTIGDLRKDEYPKIRGTEFHKLITACIISPADLIKEHVKKYAEELKNRDRITDYRARLMIVGGQLDDPGYIEVIESQGGLIVADRFCTGSMPWLEPIDSESGPFTAIAKNTLSKNLCPRMMEEFNARVEKIKKAAAEYNVDGVIIETIKFCDTWGVESTALVDALRESGLRVLRLEREYRLSGEGQLRTRVQAFIESLGK